MEAVENLRAAAKSAQTLADANAAQAAHFGSAQAAQPARSQASRNMTATVAGHKVDASMLTHNGDPAQELQIYVFAYSQVVVQRLVDMMAMELRLLLEEALVERIDEEATKEIYKKGVEVVMGMNPMDQHRRKTLADSVERLKAAADVLDGIVERGRERPS